MNTHLVFSNEIGNGLYFMPIAVFESNLSKMPGDLGDTRFNNYILEHGHKYLTEKLIITGMLLFYILTRT